MARRRWSAAWLFPIIGSMLAMIGVGLIMAGASIVIPQFGSPTLEARAHRMIDGANAGAEGGPTGVSFTPYVPEGSRPAARRLPSAPASRPAISAKLAAQRVQSPRDAALFGVMPPETPSSDFTTWDERRDVRWDLVEMAGAQRRHWQRLCTCPFYAIGSPLSGPR